MEKVSFVAVLGLAANPPTPAHLGLLETVLRSGYFNEGWLMPCYGHKFGKQLASCTDRYAMCDLLAQYAKNTVLTSAFEIEKQLDGTAVTTYKLLQETYPNKRFVWVIGYDNALNLEHWVGEPWKHIPFWIVPRTGVPIASGPMWYDHLPHYLLRNSYSSEISSTEVRRLASLGDVNCLKGIYRDCPDVLDYFTKKNLYVAEGVLS